MAGGLATGWAIKLLPLLLLSALPAVAQAQYSYTTNEGAATITGYTGPGGSVAIPGAIDGLPVTSIGEFAFLGCEGLAAVTIPSGVTNIGDQAFYECTNLVSVTMSSGVATIGFEAFAGCSSLTNVALPGSVASIMGGAFRQCGSLAGITIPSSVTAIEAEAFEYCTSLAAITVEALNSVYCSVNGVLFDKDQTQLLQYPPGRAASGYTIPDRVAVIAPAAFRARSDLVMKPRLQHVPKASDHGGNDRVRRDPARESIGIRKEVTLERRSLGVQVVDERGLLCAAQEIVGVKGHALRENARDIEPV